MFSAIPSLSSDSTFPALHLLGGLMSCIGNRPRLFISHGAKKKIIQDPEPNLGNLTPDVQSDTLPTFTSSDSKKDDFLKLGKYVLFRQSEKSDAYLAIDTTTQEELTCKVCVLLIVLIMLQCACSFLQLSKNNICQPHNAIHPNQFF